jgi:hypothetical protein
VQIRIDACNFVAGDSMKFGALKKLIAIHPDLQSIVMVPSIWEKAEVQNLLKKNGYNSYREIDSNCVLTWKQANPQKTNARSGGR